MLNVLFKTIFIAFLLLFKFGVVFVSLLPSALILAFLVINDIEM